MPFIKVTNEITKQAYPSRPAETKKYDYGLLIVIGGCKLYSGAPALAALAAFRAGVDMVRLIAPQRAADIIASFSPILASYPLEGSHLKKADVALLLTTIMGAEEVAHGKTCTVIGSGLGREEETQEAVREFLSQIQEPAVIDGDAIHAVANHPEIIRGKPFIITPHRYEFLVLTGKDVRDLPMEERITIAKEEAQRLQTTILLKGAIDIITNGDQVYINETGSPYMSIGGSGDTLAGIVGALAARNLPLLDAAGIGAYINGKAGEVAGKEKRESLVATDIIEAIPQVLP